MQVLPPTDEAVQAAVRVLHAGGVIVYPTDTVYGLGADATNADAVALVRRIKGRDAAKPILAMVADLPMLEAYAEMTPLARRLAEAYLPGPLSLVLAVRGEALAPVASVDGSAGFRLPDQPFCRAVAAAFGRPVTSTSVNRSGEPQARDIQNMLAQLGEHARDISLIVDAGTLPLRPPSTIVDARGTEPVVLRAGGISL